ncbi:DUF350 domain-containing protein [Flavobacterium sp.]|uniref:DUF350 domain-containing protein n=1 Tax=Flavobacterium sp. TaxID=239 RepID=UPI00260A6CFB|nr:DUF350 domain-containing protein [Flavobacterium sp.]
MSELNINLIINSIVFSIIGIVIMILGYFLIEKITPENTWKQIVHEKNIAVAIVLGAFIIAIAMIVSAAIHG